MLSDSYKKKMCALDTNIKLRKSKAFELFVLFTILLCSRTPDTTTNLEGNEKIVRNGVVCKEHQRGQINPSAHRHVTLREI